MGIQQKLREKIMGRSPTAGQTGHLSVARVFYNFSTDGGVVSTLTPKLSVEIPDNAVIVGGTINSTLACTSGGAATIAVGTSAGSSSTSILGATAVASFTLDARLNSAATFASPVKMTAKGYVNVTIGTAALTAGQLDIAVYFYVANA